MERMIQYGPWLPWRLAGVLSVFVLSVFFGGLAGSAVTEELTLDRLFYSPEDRTVLEILREAASHPALPAVEPRQGKEKGVQEKPQTFTLGGTVTGKSGVRAVWLNGRQYPSTALPVHVEVQKPYAAGQVVLQLDEKGKSYTLRPGQTLSLGDDRIREPYEQPPPAAAPASVRTTGAGVEPAGDSPEKP